MAQVSTTGRAVNAARLCFPIPDKPRAETRTAFFYLEYDDTRGLHTTKLTLLPLRLISTTADRLRLFLGALPDGVRVGDRPMVALQQARLDLLLLVPWRQGPDLSVEL